MAAYKILNGCLTKRRTIRNMSGLSLQVEVKWLIQGTPRKMNRRDISSHFSKCIPLSCHQPK